MKPVVNVTVGGQNKPANYTYKTVILKNNLPFAEQVTEPNCIYVIKWDFDLKGETVTMPENCMLKFEGGSLSNGKCVSSNTVLTGNYVYSSACLFGVFYDEQLNILGWGQKPIDEWNSELAFGNYLRDIEPGEYFSYNQAMAMNEDYTFLLFSEDYNNKTRAYVTIVAYDRNYNYIGYSILNTSCHGNGMTICDGNLYIATGARTVADTETLHKVAINDLLEHCVYNKGKMRSASIYTDAEIISLGSKAQSVDYDNITDTFCLYMNGGFSFYDKRFTLIDHFPVSGIGGTTLQDLVYENGIVYLFCWNSIGDGDLTATNTICFVFDVATKSLVAKYPIFYEVTRNENEGVCKDPLTGEIYISSNNHRFYGSSPVFTVTKVSHSNILKGKLNRHRINNNKWINDGIGGAVYIDNQYTGHSDGGQSTPYKTLGEAIVCAEKNTTRPEFYLAYSETPYYCYQLKLSDSYFRLYGMKSGDACPVLDTVIVLRDTTANLQNLHIKAGENHLASDYVLSMQQYCNCMIVSCKFTTDAISANSRSMSLENNSVASISNCEFTNTKVPSSSHISMRGNGGVVNIGAVKINDGALVNPRFDDTYFGNTVNFYNLQNINIPKETPGYLIYSNFQTVDAVNLPPITSLDEYNALINLLGGDAISKTASFRVKVYITSAFTLNNDWVPVGLYVNDIKNSAPTLRNIAESRIAGPEASGPNRPNTSGVLGGMFFDTSLSPAGPIWWNGTNWVDANGYKAVRNRGTVAQMQALISGTDPELTIQDQGFMFFLTNEGYPCWLKEVNQNTVKWVKADGTDAPTN